VNNCHKNKVRRSRHQWHAAAAGGRGEEEAAGGNNAKLHTWGQQMMASNDDQPLKGQATNQARFRPRYEAAIRTAGWGVTPEREGNGGRGGGVSR